MTGLTVTYLFALKVPASVLNVVVLFLDIGFIFNLSALACLWEIRPWPVQHWSISVVVARRQPLSSGKVTTAVGCNWLFVCPSAANSLPMDLTLWYADSPLLNQYLRIHPRIVWSSILDLLQLNWFARFWYWQFLLSRLFDFRCFNLCSRIYRGCYCCCYCCFCHLCISSCGDSGNSLYICAYRRGFRNDSLSPW